MTRSQILHIKLIIIIVIILMTAYVISENIGKTLKNPKRKKQ